jgi:hypothetical protein
MIRSFSRTVSISWTGWKNANKAINQKIMKTKIRPIKTSALAAALILGGMGVAQALEADTNATTVAYWKFGGTASVPLNSPSGVGILDLATNTGQGTVAGTVAGVPVSVQDLWYQGPLASNPTFVGTVPPASMFNPNNYFTAGSGSWDCGADQYPSTSGSLVCDNATYGNSFNGPDFTFEIYFKSDTTNDPTTGTQVQSIIFDHHQSAYAFLYLNDNANNDTNDIGSLRFWSWNVAVFGIDCRITAAQNHGHRLDDGQWHYAAMRFNTATETMNLLVVNQDGTSTETSSYITVPLNPGGSGSQGPLFIGCDEGQNVPFDGLINQIRYSNASLPANKLLANAASCNAPVFNNAASTNSVAVGDVLLLSPAFWPVQIQGGPLKYQWQLNGANVSGQTNLAINLFPVIAADAGIFKLIATTPCGGISVTSAPMTVTVVPKVPVNLARWGFNFTEANTFPQATVDDLAPNFLNVYDLITFNAAPNISGIGGNGEIALTNSIPPVAMFINGNNGGTNAFDSSYIGGGDGVVFYPAGPDVFDFQTSFSLELFFRSYGDLSASGPMELICQGTDGGNTFRYGVNLNQAGPGALSFKINNLAITPAGPAFEDTNSGIQSVVISNQNYADGNWHYLLAQYDSTANKISLKVANADGTGTNATTVLPAGYSPLAGNFEGNLFVGRMRYPFGDDNRNFNGAIDEVQVSSGLVTPSTGQLGYVVGPPNLTGIKVSGNTVTIQFAGSPSALPSSFTLVGSPTVNGTYSNLSATITALGGGNFQAVIAKSGAAEFYKIKH